ncbi:hypothetical protein [Hymenobacter defluvii]|uniref:Uncharacterized protein n=1 Tax=Hymenobacter defluvii TaxID=2054411 RepID=A0ABS3TAQ2_9BACT|nr:hypothetical protein [Hymenobacter defluvii]MBO3270731.1 hypothetical protein [Hymenobacter defluvii]
MNATVRRNNAIASYLYLVSLTLYMIPVIYLFLNPVGKIPAPLFVIIALALFLGFLIVVGIKLRAGKMWAKVLVLLNAAGMSIFCLYGLPNLLHSSPFTIMRILSFLALNLGTLWFLFKAYRAASYGAGVAVGQA